MPPQPRTSARAPAADAAEALAAVAPLATRWIERLLAAHSPPLTVSEFLALRAIGRESVSGSQLASRAGVSGPAVSQLLAGLRAAQLIDARPGVDDRRRQELTLTSTGRLALRSAQSRLNERLAALLAGMPPPEAGVLARLLGDVEAALSGVAPPRRPPARRPPPPPQGHPAAGRPPAQR